MKQLQKPKEKKGRQTEYFTIAPSDAQQKAEQVRMFVLLNSEYFVKIKYFTPMFY